MMKIPKEKTQIQMMSKIGLTKIQKLAKCKKKSLMIYSTPLMKMKMRSVKVGISERRLFYQNTVELGNKELFGRPKIVP